MRWSDVLAMAVQQGGGAPAAGGGVVQSYTLGTEATGSSATLTPINPTHQAGDLLIAVAWGRALAAITCATAGWAEVTGSPLSHASAGLMRVAVFANYADSSSETDPAIDMTSSNTCIAQVVRVRASASFVSNAITFGSISSNGAGATIPFTADSPSIADGDGIFAIALQSDDAGTQNTILLTNAGVTFTELYKRSNTTGLDEMAIIDSGINSSGSSYTAGTLGVITITGGTSPPSMGFYMRIAHP